MIRMETIDNNTLRLEESVRTALLQADEAILTKALAGHHPADLAEVMERLINEDAIRVFRALDSERAAEVLDELDQQKARYLLDNEVPERIAALLDLLPMDDAAEVLSYPKSSAGRLMTEKFMRLTPELTVEEAFAAVR